MVSLSSVRYGVMRPKSISFRLVMDICWGYTESDVRVLGPSEEESAAEGEGRVERLTRNWESQLFTCTTVSKSHLEFDIAF